MKMCYETDHCLVSSLIDYSTSRGLGKAIEMITFQKNIWGGLIVRIYLLTQSPIHYSFTPWFNSFTMHF